VDAALQVEAEVNFLGRRHERRDGEGRHDADDDQLPTKVFVHELQTA
jgi:hypothetical protein